MKKLLLCLILPVVVHAQDTRIIPEQPTVSRAPSEPQVRKPEPPKGRGEQPPHRELPQHPEGRDGRGEQPPRIIHERPIIIERAPIIYEPRYPNRGISIYLDVDRCRVTPGEFYWGAVTPQQRMLLIDAQLDFCSRVRQILLYP